MSVLQADSDEVYPPVGINGPLGITVERQSVNMMDVSGEHADVILLKHALR